MSQPLIYIDNELVDLDPRFNMALTYQINEIGDTKDRRTTGTNRAKALFTEKNNALFGYSNVVQSLSESTKKIIPALFDNGSGVYYGDLYIDKISDGYDIQFLTGNNGFFNSIEGKKLSDLITLDEYNRNWSSGFMVAAYGSATSPTFIIQDDGTLPSGTRVVNVQKQFWSLYASDVFQKIIEEAGYTFDGSLFSNNLYQSLILPFTNDKPKKDSDLKVEAFTSADYTINFSGTTKEKLLFDDDSVLGVDVFNQWTITPTYTYFRPAIVSDAKLELFLDVTLNVPNPSVGFKLAEILLMKESVVTGAVSVVKVVGSYFKGWNGQRRQIKYSGDMINYQTANYFLALYPLDNTGTATIYEESFVKITPVEDAVYGDIWSFRQNMPDITQKDFIKAIMQITGAIIDTDVLNQSVRFELFETITSEDAKSTAVNIDEFLSGKPKEIDEHPDGHAQKNWLRFKKDERVTEYYGDSFFTIEDETLPKESTLVTLPFAASMKKPKLIDLDVWEVLRTYNGADVTPQPRLLVKSVQTGLSPAITFLDGGTVGTSTEYHYGSFDDYVNSDYQVDWKSILNTLYVNRIEVLKNYKKVTETAHFNANFINQLDLFDPVFSHYYSAFFIINKITSYQSGKTCNVELIRI